MKAYLKKGIAEEQSRAADKSVRETVERILADIEARGDTAIRDTPKNSTAGRRRRFG